MLKHEPTSSDARKLNIKQFKRRAQTLVKKAVELVSSCRVELLIVIHSNELKQYIEYCNVDPTQLYFSLQAAKETLGRVEVWKEEIFQEARTKETKREASTISPPLIKKHKSMQPPSSPTHSTKLMRKETAEYDLGASLLSTESTESHIHTRRKLAESYRSRSIYEPSSGSIETQDTPRFFDWLNLDTKTQLDSSTKLSNSSPEWDFELLLSNDPCEHK